MECFICFEPIGDEDLFKGPCNHSFCMDCYYKLRKLECPMCRAMLKKDRHHPAWGRTLVKEEEHEREIQFNELDEENMFSIPLEYIDMSCYDDDNIMGWRVRRRKKRERNARKKEQHRNRKKQKKLTRRQRNRRQHQMENRAGIYRRTH